MGRAHVVGQRCGNWSQFSAHPFPKIEDDTTFSSRSVGPIGDEEQFSNGLCLTGTLLFQLSSGLYLPAQALLEECLSPAQPYPCLCLAMDPLALTAHLGLGPTSPPTTCLMSMAVILLTLPGSLWSWAPTGKVLALQSPCPASVPSPSAPGSP